MNRGIILIAINHPHYMQLAANLAMSIKHNCPDYSITVFHDNDLFSYLTPIQQRYFDDNIGIDSSLYVIEGIKHYGLLKLRLNELAEMTKYDTVLYIDVDSILLPDKSLSYIFEQTELDGFCAEFNGAISTRGDISKSISGMARFGNIVDKFRFKCDVMPESVNTSYIGFIKNNLDAVRIFNEAQIVFSYYLRYGGYKKWYGSVSDQLLIPIACAITGFEPIYNLNYCNYSPTINSENKSGILNDYLIYSLPTGEGDASSTAIAFYNELMGYYERTSKEHRATHWRNKRVANHNKAK